MKPAHQDSFVTLYISDAIEGLRQIETGSVHTTVCSPPYWNLRSYLDAGHEHKGRELGAESSPAEYVEKLCAVFDEVWRVLRDDGTLWLNLGDGYAGGGGYHPGAPSNQPEARSQRGQYRPNYDNARVSGSGVPRGLKPKDLIGIPWRVAFALQDRGWYLRSDIIWCLSGGARVYARTQKGEMPMMVKELARLDPATVQLWNGEKWTQATHFTQNPRPVEPLEIELRSGERIGCTPEHLWPTQRDNVRADDLEVGDVIETCELPEPRTPKRSATLDEEVGWLCGLYLAEGNIDGDKVIISGHADETAERLRRLEKIAHEFHGSVWAYTDGNKATIHLYGPILASVVRAYVHGDSASSKGLKVRVWQRENAFLFSLLRGYLEGDGHLDEKNQRWRLGFTRNDRLAADLRTLAARLGLSLRLAPRTAKAFGREWPIYRGDLRLTNSEHHNTRKQGEVVAIGRSRARQFWDIGVEDESHLFALASGVLTHNCKPNPMPESVQDRPTSAHEHVFMLSKQPRYYFDMEAVREPGRDWGGRDRENTQNRERFFRGNGHPAHKGLTNGDASAGRNLRNVWTLSPSPFKGSHFATFPLDLPIRCIKAATSEHGVCAECGAPYRRLMGESYEVKGRAAGNGFDREHRLSVGGRGDETPWTPKARDTVGWEPTCSHETECVPATILDPFAGSGTTMLAARKLGRKSVGIDLDSRSVGLLQARLGYQEVLL